MKARTPDTALIDMIHNLSRRSAINAAFAGTELMNDEDIDGFNSNFDYMEFIFSDAFHPETHLAKNKDRIWPLLNSSFLPHECDLYNFNEKTCGTRMDKDTVRRAIILWAVASALEFEYLQNAHFATMKLLNGKSVEEQQHLLMEYTHECSPITIGKVLHGELTQLMNLVLIQEFQPIIQPIRQKIESSDVKTVRIYAADIMSILTDDLEVLRMPGMKDVLITLANFVNDPSAKNAKRCADKAGSLYSLLRSNQNNNLEKVIEKLYLINCITMIEAKKQHGLFGGEKKAETNAKVSHARTRRMTK